VTLTATDIGSGVCTLGWSLSFLTLGMHGIILRRSSFAAQKDGIVVGLILGRASSFVKLLVGSK
jgi:hypothetical protein